MPDALSQLRDDLVAGMRLALQGSYERHAPSKESIPSLARVRERIMEFVHENPGDAEAWRLLSQAHECLLAYGKAVKCLETALSLSQVRDKRDIKRLARLKQGFAESTKLPIPITDLQNLGRFLSNAGVDADRSTGLRLTREWLEGAGVPNCTEFLAALDSRGLFTDWEVLRFVQAVG